MKQREKTFLSLSLKPNGATLTNSKPLSAIFEGTEIWPWHQGTYFDFQERKFTFFFSHFTFSDLANALFLMLSTQNSPKKLTCIRFLYVYDRNSMYIVYGRLMIYFLKRIIVGIKVYSVQLSTNSCILSYLSFSPTTVN